MKTVALVCASIAWLAGCGGHSGDSTATSTSATTTKPHSNWTRPAAPPDPQTLLHAGSVAVAAVPNGKLTLIRSQEAGSWRVLVATPDGTNQSMDVSSDGVTLMVGPTPANQSDADKAQTRAWVQAAKLDYRAAAQKILAIIAGASISELSLGDSNGATVWQAVAWDSYIVEHRVTIDAVSGDVIANKQV
ncbi:metallopeptidase [Mycobacterium ahvazicum]|uniref:metallopeptidase n=1 Tax=Mycobacterium ahvazicum TaxID=1964395 RepID=UPI000BB87658|nr:metallopeptidase [Mycobacterium ahvazicum]